MTRHLRSYGPVIAILCMVAPIAAHAGRACPAAVTDAATKAVPDATITRCVAEHSIFEVVMHRKDKSRVELDVTAKGVIEQIEETVPVSAVPAAVTKAFAARYPKASVLRAEKQTKADKSVSFELAFKVGASVKEATFKDDGTFVEEE
jgi:hypothetical protein